MVTQETQSRSQSPAAGYLGTISGHEGIFSFVIQRDTLTPYEIYLRGKQDGVKDIQEEALKMAKALFQIAQQKAEAITNQLMAVANEKGITIERFCLRLKSWEKISMILIVKLEDYLDDKIEDLYEHANSISDTYNNKEFMWEYIITYASENLSMEKIISEGYTLFYEPKGAESRKAQ